MFQSDAVYAPEVRNEDTRAHSSAKALVGMYGALLEPLRPEWVASVSFFDKSFEAHFSVSVANLSSEGRLGQGGSIRRRM